MKSVHIVTAVLVIGLATAACSLLRFSTRGRLRSISNGRGSGWNAASLAKQARLADFVTSVRGLWKLPRLPADVGGRRKARPAFGRTRRSSRRPPTTALENRGRFPTAAWKTADGFPQFPQPR